jgi:hypothetical protein
MKKAEVILIFTAVERLVFHIQQQATRHKHDTDNHDYLLRDLYMIEHDANKALELMKEVK